jgi:ABC-type nitrate/sulfonate/bicarbonate transport system substrate-binding protein
MFDVRPALWGALWVGLALAAGNAALAQTKTTPIRISVQPGNYSAIAYKVATAQGYWQEAGLQPTFVPYPAGVPQIKAHADWDVGTLGAVPALIGARDFDLITIAVANDESRTNVLMGKKDFVAKLKSEKKIPAGTRIAVTPNSTGDYAAQTCLAFWGGKTKSDMVYTGMTQPEIISAGTAGSVDLVAVWAPNSYAMQEQHGFETLCSGKDFTPGVFGVMVANRKWAQGNPDVVARLLSVVVRANLWIKRNPQQAQQIHIEGSAKENVKISASAAKNDYELRQVFSLDEQLGLMQDASGDVNDARVGRAFYSLNVFLNEGKPQTRMFRASTFVDTSYLVRLRSDPALMRFTQQ